MRVSHGRSGCVLQRPTSTAGGKGGEEAKREASLPFYLIYGHASILWRLQSEASIPNHHTEKSWHRVNRNAGFSERISEP